MRAAVNPGLWPNLMPNRPRWRRHVPPALLLLALSSLLVGVARPQATLPADQKETTVVLTVDTSNSMAAKDVTPSRIAAARAAARALVKGLPATAKVGIVAFARDAHVLLRQQELVGGDRKHLADRAIEPVVEVGIVHVGGRDDSGIAIVAIDQENALRGAEGDALA